MPIKVSLTLICIALLGASLILCATPYGLGILPDSVTYLASAREFRLGNGFYIPNFDGSFRPLVHFPPLYPILLAISPFQDLFVWARIIGATFFFANIFLIGTIAYRSTNSFWAATVASLVSTISINLISVHTQMLSEPPFLTCLLLYFLLLQRAENRPEKNNYRSLILLGLVAGLASICRYAGLSLGAFALLSEATQYRGEIKLRVKRFLILAGTAALPLVIWCIRNFYLTESSTGRNIQLHLPPLSQLSLGVSEVASWLVPAPLLESELQSYLFVGVFAVLCILVWWRIIRPVVAESANDLYIPNQLIAWCFWYLTFLFISLSLFDAGTPLNYRILAPIFPSLLLFTILSGYRLLQLRRGSQNFAKCLVFFSVIFIIAHSFSAFSWISIRKLDGFGFASMKWRESELVKMVDQFSPNEIIYSNAPEIVYLYSGRIAKNLPNIFQPGSRQLSPDLSERLDELRQVVLQGSGVIAYFRRVRWRWYQIKEKDLLDAIPLAVGYDNGDEVLLWGVRARSEKR